VIDGNTRQSSVITDFLSKWGFDDSDVLRISEKKPSHNFKIDAKNSCLSTECDFYLPVSHEILREDKYIIT